jgi:hypothetical protein
MWLEYCGYARFLVEQRLQDAVSRGELDNLPGSGRPLELHADPLVPEDVRVAYRLLKNACLVPPELETVKKVALLRTKLEVVAARRAWPFRRARG